MGKFLPFVLVCLALAQALAAEPALARDIILQAGESYRSQNDNIVCLAGKQTTPMVIKDCQIWEEFGEICLYEKRIMSVSGQECEEKCQHWDSFNKVCQYETRCRFLPEHNVFIHTTCLDFDTFNNTCRREKEEKTGAAQK